MTKIHAAGVAVALGFAMAFLSPFEAAAAKSGGGAGFGARSFHSGRSAISHRAFSHRPLAHRHRAFRQFPWVGGGVVSWPYGFWPNYAPGPGFDAPRVVVMSPPEPPRALTCQRSRDTVNVQSEDGGIREIRITRC